MTRDQIEYLESVTRMNLRKKEREFEKLQRKPEQERRNFDKFVEHQREQIEFIKQVLVDLRAARGEATHTRRDRIHVH